MHLRSLQGLALHVANSIFLGDYLTSEGQAAEADLEMIRDNGFVVLGATRRGTAPPRHSHDPAIRRRGAGTDVAAQRLTPSATPARVRPRAPVAPLHLDDRPDAGPAGRSAAAYACGWRTAPSWSTGCRPGGRRSTATHPALDEAARRAAGDMAHVMFGGLTHEPAVRLAERLVEIRPTGLEQVFLADSGSVWVEVALKMVLQYQRGAGRPERTRMLTVRGGYHGDTFGCMSVCDPVGGMHAMFGEVLPRQVFAAAARCRADVDAWAAGFERWPRRTPTSWPGSSSSRCCRAPAACTSTPPSACGCCARSPTSTTWCWSSTRSRPASAAPARCSPPTRPGSPPTSCASARR